MFGILHAITARRAGASRGHGRKACENIFCNDSIEGYVCCGPAVRVAKRNVLRRNSAAQLPYFVATFSCAKIRLNTLLHSTMNAGKSAMLLQSDHSMSQRTEGCLRKRSGGHQGGHQGRL
eukprot:3982618-Prymnesium_polylepis.1